MGILACPTDLVGATPERIWGLVTDAALIAEWSGTRLEQGPGRPLQPGDSLVLRKGPARIQIRVLAMEAPKELAMEIQLPFSVVNHEVIRISRGRDGLSRVTYN